MKACPICGRMSKRQPCSRCSARRPPPAPGWPPPPRPTAPPPPAPTAPAGFSSIPEASTAESLRWDALLALEHALVAEGRAVGGPALEAEVKAGIARYEKLKGYAIRGVGGEQRNGFKLALKQLIDLVY